MDKFLIKGPCKIKGQVSISGSKNAALPILASTILFEKAVIIKNQKLVPKLMKKLDLLNQKLGESQGIITKLTPDNKLIGA